MATSRRRYQQEITTINKDTNEIITNQKTFSRVVTTDQFYMSFIDNMSGFFKITCVLDVKLLAKLCSMAQYNTGHVSVSRQGRKDLVICLGTTTQNISNSINRLKKLGLISGEGGDYDINPTVFWKGTRDERDKLLKDGGLEVKLKFKAQEDDN